MSTGDQGVKVQQHATPARTPVSLPASNGRVQAQMMKKRKNVLKSYINIK